MDSSTGTLWAGLCLLAMAAEREALPKAAGLVGQLLSKLDLEPYVCCQMISGLATSGGPKVAWCSACAVCDQTHAMLSHLHPHGKSDEWHTEAQQGVFSSS